MPIFHPVLTGPQERLLRSLGDDAITLGVGRELRNLTREEIRIADLFVREGLVELFSGSGRTVWYRITEAGRRVLPPTS